MRSGSAEAGGRGRVVRRALRRFWVVRRLLPLDTSVTLLAWLAPRDGCVVGYHRHIRLHITVDDELVAELDRGAGSRRRSAFIAELIRRGLEDGRRWDDIEAALGTIADEGHEWDSDPGEWVRQQRSDRRRVG